MPGYPQAPELTAAPPARPRRTVLGRMHDDGGAVAILVALSVSTFLLAVAALAVDLGQVYTRNGELQSVADVAALAGATELPNVTDARRKALDTLCADANRLPGWATNGTCPTSAAAGLPIWVTNGDPGDGEIVLYRGWNAVTGLLDPGTVVTNDAQDAVGIRVSLPPSTVQFGLARSFGASNVSVTKAASARIGTPEGLGVLPFAVTVNDARQADTRKNRFCIVDPLAGGTVAGAPRPTFPARRLVTDRTDLALPTAGQTLRITPQNPGFPFPFGTPRVFLDGVAQTVVGTPTRNLITARVTSTLTRGTYSLWVVWGTGPFAQTSFPVRIAVDGGGAATGDACDRPDATRGVLDIARVTSAPATNFQRNLDLGNNIKTGIVPTPHRYTDFPVVLIPLLGNLLRGLQCFPGVVPGLVQILTNVLGGVTRPDINCVNTRDAGFSAGLTEGLVGNGGRLTHRCSDDPTVALPNGRQVDDTKLFSADSELVDHDALSAAGLTLDGLIADNQVARGVINGKIFACGRLGLVPVIDPVDDLGTGVGNGVYPIADFTYVWIGDGNAGLHFNGTNLSAVEFTILDPAFFGRTVSGSPKVGPWLGDGLPREVLLVKDADDD
jgi:hypothetical protein